MKRYKITENNITYDILEYNDGSIYCFLNNKLHRANGPAAIWHNGYKEYWYNNKHLEHV